ncbi:MAG: type II secretion system F family protein [Solirubrobacterales bacterium]
MATFAFKAVDVGGGKASGEVEADTKSQVTERLRQQGLIVLDISEQKEAFAIEDLWKKYRRVKGRDLAVMSRQFATMIAAGMPMLRTLYTLEEQTEDELLAETMGFVRADVEAGSSLSQAMAKHPKVFDKLYCSMVESGENSGQLEQALDRVSDQMEKLDALQRQVKSALMYPTIVMIFAFLILLALITFIVPVFVGTFEDIAKENPDVDASLPALTQLVVNASDLVTGRWYIMLPLAIGGFYAFRRWKETEKGKRIWDRMMLKVPMKIGDVVQKVALARWSRTFAGLVTAGVPLLQSVKITGRTSGNAVIEDAMDSVYESIKRGGTIAGPLHNEEIFPDMVCHMVGVGEESGALEHMLEKTAEFYETEVEAKIKALTSILEPVMLIFVGGMVGVIVIAMYLPIFSLYDKIG